MSAAFDADALRIFLHILGATVWVGGQLTLAALVGVLRGFDGAARAVAQRFNVVAWPAFALLVVTGIWNILDVNDTSTRYQVVLGVKLLVVVASGLTAWLHGRASNRAAMALWGALTGLTALLALFLGAVLTG